MTTVSFPERRVVVAAIAAAVAVLVVVVSVVVATTDAERLVPGLGPDCTVESEDRTVELSTAQAEDAASAAARGRLPGDEAIDIDRADLDLVAAALNGRVRAALSCTHGGSDDNEADQLDRSGLTKRAAVVRRDLDEAFGPQKLGGFARGGVTSGHQPGSAHYEGRALDVFFRPISRAQKRRGWAMAQYLVAHAQRLEIDTVIFDGRIWTARRGIQGWRDYEPDTSGRTRAVARILEHRDHVHVDVAD